MADVTLNEKNQKEITDLIKKYEQSFEMHPSAGTYYAGKIIKTIQCHICKEQEEQ